MACLKKELGNPRLSTELVYLDRLEDQMKATLSDMVPDQDDKIEPDLDIYQEMGESYGS